MSKPHFVLATCRADIDPAKLKGKKLMRLEHDLLRLEWQTNQMTEAGYTVLGFVVTFSFEAKRLLDDWIHSLNIQRVQTLHAQLNHAEIKKLIREKKKNAASTLPGVDKKMARSTQSRVLIKQKVPDVLATHYRRYNLQLMPHKQTQLMFRFAYFGQVL
ncbi:MAG: hypothetical protein V4672_10015 [Verrucomicrobiota bacterium]